jgi:hypothetical protein
MYWIFVLLFGYSVAAGDVEWKAISSDHPYFQQLESPYTYIELDLALVSPSVFFLITFFQQSSHYNLTLCVELVGVNESHEEIVKELWRDANVTFLESFCLESKEEKPVEKRKNFQPEDNDNFIENETLYFVFRSVFYFSFQST